MSRDLLSASLKGPRVISSIGGHAVACFLDDHVSSNLPSLHHLLFRDRSPIGGDYHRPRLADRRLVNDWLSQELH